MASPARRKNTKKKTQRELTDGMSGARVIAPQQERSLFELGQLNARLPLIVPDRWHCRFRYRNQRTVTTTFASQPFWWAVALNSLYDPDVSGAGGTVTGFSQMMALYQNAVVVRAKATFTLVNNSASAASTFPTRLVALASATSSSLTTSYNIPDAAEQFYCAEAILGSQGGNSSIVTLTLDVPVHKVFGVKKTSILDEISFWGTAGANPTKLGTIQLGAVAMDGSLALAFIWALDIEYEAILFNRVVFT